MPRQLRAKPHVNASRPKIGTPEWQAWRAQLLTNESGKPLRWFFINFYSLADEFLGAVITEACGPMHAIEKVLRLDLYPDGSLQCFGMTSLTVPEAARDRLLRAGDLEPFTDLLRAGLTKLL